MKSSRLSHPSPMLLTVSLVLLTLLVDGLALPVGGGRFLKLPESDQHNFDRQLAKKQACTGQACLFHAAKHTLAKAADEHATRAEGIEAHIRERNRAPNSLEAAEIKKLQKESREASLQRSHASTHARMWDQKSQHYGDKATALQQKMHAKHLAKQPVERTIPLMEVFEQMDRERAASRQRPAEAGPSAKIKGGFGKMMSKIGIGAKKKPDIASSSSGGSWPADADLPREALRSGGGGGSAAGGHY